MKIGTILKSISIVIIFVIFFLNQLLAIVLTLIFLVIAVISYLFSLTFKKKLIRIISTHARIVDKDIAQKINYPIQKLRKKLKKLHKHQKNRVGLFVFLNNRYIFYNKEAIDEFKKLYNNGLKEKEIFENLKITINLRTRAEIKVIEDTLINHNKIEKKDIKAKIKNPTTKNKIF
jgi:hypothetical protein